MSLDEIIFRIILGLIIGFFVGLTSIGSGVLVLPILTLLLKDLTMAIGTTTLYAFLTKIIASFNHIKLKTIKWDIASSFLIGAIPSTFIFALIISSSKTAKFEQLLSNIIILIIIFGITMMILDTFKFKNHSNKNSLIKTINSNKKAQTITAFLFGLICGALVGSTSIGAGIIVIPILITLFKLKASQAVGTSIFMAFIMTMITSLIFGLNGQQDYQTAIIMSIGSLIGIIFGSKLSIILSDLILRIIVITLMILGLFIMLL